MPHPRWLPARRSTGRQLRRWAAGVGLLSASLSLVACGANDTAAPGSGTSPSAEPNSSSAPTTEPPATPTPSTPASPTPSSPETGQSRLTIVIKDGKTTQSTWQLSCDPAGGDHPDPAKACAALQKNGATAMPAASKDKMCTQIYGGAQTAVVTGTYRGKAVKSQFNLTDGCQIARWNALTGLLPKPTLER